MTNELIKGFLEQAIEGIDGISEALRILLQYYHVAATESECEPEYTDIDSYIEPGNEYMDNFLYEKPYINPDIDADID